MAMENGPFEDVFPIENGDFPASYVRLPECNLMILGKDPANQLADSAADWCLGSNLATKNEAELTKRVLNQK